MIEAQLDISEPPLLRFHNLTVRFMPTVHREDGIAFRIYPNDHGPPHVHAVKDGGFAKILIGDADVPPRVLKVGRELKEADLLKAVRVIECRWVLFVHAWRRIHG